MTGAESLLRTAASCGITVCFANPGTSEMHFLAALESVPEIKPILGLFEGGVTGMADGFARVTGKPAITLLHLGTGFSNGIANLHNARRARSPVVNIVGEHATYHNQWDSPLRTDIAGLARPVSDWLRISSSPQVVAADVAAAIAASREATGRVATLILPADAAWGRADGVAPAVPEPSPQVDQKAIERVAAILKDRGESSLILVRDAAGHEAGIHALERICTATRARAMADLVAPRCLRGRDVFAVPRVPYRAEGAVAAMAGISDLILVGTHAPIAPFAYPNYPSWCVPEGVKTTYLSLEHESEVHALEGLADVLSAQRAPRPASVSSSHGRPCGTLTASAIGFLIARHLPEGAVISEEAISNAQPILAELADAAPHLHLPLTGGAIGQGIPLATGAAVGVPDSKVVNIQADGSAMYTLQALWTQARERLDVVTVILANRSYGVLKAEVERVEAQIGSELASGLLEIGNPTLDFVALAKGMGVEASRASTAEELDDQLADAMRRRGPRLIEAVLA